MPVAQHDEPASQAILLGADAFHHS